MLNSNLASFQVGVNTIYNKCVSQGVTPTAKTPDAIAVAIGKLKTITGYNVKQYTKTDQVNPSGTVRIFTADTNYKGVFSFWTSSWSGAYNQTSKIIHYSSNGTEKKVLLNKSGAPKHSVTLNDYIVYKGEYINATLTANGSSSGYSYVDCVSTHSLLYET